MHGTWTKLKNVYELKDNCNCNIHHKQNRNVSHTLPFVDTRIYKK